MNSELLGTIGAIIAVIGCIFVFAYAVIGAISIIRNEIRESQEFKIREFERNYELCALRDIVDSFNNKE